MTRIWIAGLTLSLAACSGATDEADSMANPVALVTLAPAEQGVVANELTLYGAVEAGPAGKLALVAPAEGTVVAIDAPAGTPVRRGQVVARLQPSPTTASTSPGQAAMRPPPTPRSPARSGYAPTGSAAMPRSSARRRPHRRRHPRLARRARRRAHGACLRRWGRRCGHAIAGRPGPGRGRHRVDHSPHRSARALRPGASLGIAANAGRPTFTVPIESTAPVIDPQTPLEQFPRDVNRRGISKRAEV